MFETNIKEKNIAVVGVSKDPHKYGHKIFVDLLKNGFRVYGVNPNASEIAGERIFKNLQEIVSNKIKIDLVILVVRPDVSEKIIDECQELGIKEIWLQPGAESNEAIEKAERYGMSITYGACFMVRNKIW